MKYLFLILTICLLLTQATQAQLFFTKNGKISFFSKTSMENIEAVNNQVVSVLNIKTGDMAFSVLINGFLFKKSLMQEHFNENYMESEKYPKAGFKGTVTDFSKIDFIKDGIYPVSVSGDLSIHGITNKVTVSGTISIKSGSITASALFKVLLQDYKISVPKLVEDNISKSIDIKMDCNYIPKK